MFTRWTIGNFKSIREPVTLDLAPLTIFSGINSSGKSTLIQSILMLAQSFSSAVDDEALVLNGRFLQLGRLHDVLHYGNDSQPIEIGFDWLPADQLIDESSLVIHLDAQIKRSSREQLQGKRTDRHFPCLSQSTLAFEKVQRIKSDKVRLNVIRTHEAAKLAHTASLSLPANLRQQIDEGLFNYTITQPAVTSLVSDTRLERAERVALANLIPARLLVAVDTDLRQAVDDVEWFMTQLKQSTAGGEITPRGKGQEHISPRFKEVLRLVNLEQGDLPNRSLFDSKGRPREDIAELRHRLVTFKVPLTRGIILNMLYEYRYAQYERDRLHFGLAAALVEFLQRQTRFSPGNDVAYEERLLPADLMNSIDQIRRIMGEQIYFLGPLRDEPRVIYDSPTSSERWSVGHRGEFMAAMLDEYRDLTLRYPLPPDDHFAGQYLVKEGKLVDALTLWLQRMGLVETISTEEAPKIGYRLTVSSPGLRMPLDLTSVGVGVSQILPTLVQTLLAPVGSILIFEQPELHLHPKVQSVLGDFFLGMAQMGKQCVVETHSEHLINRLRRRIVESEKGTVLPNLRIYFAEKEGTATRFREVKPNEYGSILDWPEGFFDQAENEASLILRAQLDKHREAATKQSKREV